MLWANIAYQQDSWASEEKFTKLKDFLLEKAGSISSRYSADTRGQPNFQPTPKIQKIQKLQRFKKFKRSKFQKFKISKVQKFKNSKAKSSKNSKN